MPNSILTFFLVVAIATPLWTRLQPTDSKRTVQDGVFSEAQSIRGQNLYESYCLQCHGESLLGGQARALVGKEFLRNWIGLSLDDLFQRVQTMPPGSATTLDNESYIDIISFMLKKNDFPPSSNELRIATLSNIVVEDKNTPQEVPDQTLVQVIGCLTDGAPNTWLLVNATSPVRTRDPSSSIAAEQFDLKSIPLGSALYELLYVFPDPGDLAGHRVEAKGFLIRGKPDRINITSLTGLNETDPDCAH